MRAVSWAGSRARAAPSSPRSGRPVRFDCEPHGAQPRRPRGELEEPRDIQVVPSLLRSQKPPTSPTAMVTTRSRSVWDVFIFLVASMMVEMVSRVQGGGIDAQLLVKVMCLSRQLAERQDDYNIPCVWCMWHDYSKIISRFTFGE